MPRAVLTRQARKQRLSLLRHVQRGKEVLWPLRPADEAGRAVLMLDPANFATLLSLLDYYTYGDREAIKDGVIPGLYGFKAVIENNALPVGAKGALIAEDALVIAGRRIEVQSPRVYQEVGYTTDEDSGLTLGIRRGADWATGMNSATVEALFGAAFVQPAKAVKLT